MQEAMEAVSSAKFTFSPTIKVREHEGSPLLWDPRTGSWCFVTDKELQAIQGLKFLSQSADADRIPSTAHPLLETLYNEGLVARDGRYSWSKDWFIHHDNKVNTLILKVVGACNLACTYCYDYNASRFGKTMDLETARAAVDGVWERSDKVLNVLFHGGEPMMAKELIFALVPEIHERAKASGKEILFSIQTNGTMFDDEWCELMEKYQISVGVSLDGEAKSNDRFRITHSGRGTFQRIWDKIEQYNLVKQIGVLTTVTSQNVNQLLEVALRFQALGVEKWGTTLFQSAGRGEGHEDLFEPEIEDLVRAHLELLEAVEQGLFPTMEIQGILHYVRNVLTYKRYSMCQRTSCGAAADLISISVDGAIEGCDCIANPDLRLGKLENAASISDALDSPVAETIRSRHVDRLSPCMDCDWRVVCGGSCLASAGTVDAVEPSECALSLALFPAILDSLAKSDRLAAYARRFG